MESAGGSLEKCSRGSGSRGAPRRLAEGHRGVSWLLSRLSSLLELGLVLLESGRVLPLVEEARGRGGSSVPRWWCAATNKKGSNRGVDEGTARIQGHGWGADLEGCGAAEEGVLAWQGLRLWWREKLDGCGDGS